MTTRDRLKNLRPPRAQQEPRRHYVVELSTSRHYGGPEEGGWWYDHTDVESVRAFDRRGPARRCLRALRREAAKYKPRYNRFSVLGGNDHDTVLVHSRADVDDLQTRRRPRYE